jgi:hypothetical protein
VDKMAGDGRHKALDSGANLMNFQNFDSRHVLPPDWPQRFTDEWKARAKAYAQAHSKIGFAWNGTSQDIAANHAKSMRGELP